MITYQVEVISQDEDHLGEGECFALHFTSNDIEVCTVLLAPTKGGSYETHISDLPHDLINQGFGVEVYRKVFEFCIHNGMNLSSSKNRCDDAERLWKSIRLNQMFEIKNDKDRYYLIGPKADRRLSVT